MGCHALLQRSLPNPGIEPRSPTLQADSLASEPPAKPTASHRLLIKNGTLDSNYLAALGHVPIKYLLVSVGHIYSLP